MKEGIVIGLTGQKGGTGKTSIANAICTYAKYVKKLNVIGIDLDEQKSWKLNRLRDESDLPANINKDDLFPIKSMSCGGFFQACDSLREEFDLIIVDFPGSLSQNGVGEAYTQLDQMFLPTDVTDNEIVGTSMFLQFYKDVIKPLLNKIDLPEPKITGVFTKISKNLLNYKDREKALKLNGNIDEFGIAFIKEPFTYAKAIWGQYSNTYSPLMSGKGEIAYPEVFELIFKEIEL